MTPRPELGPPTTMQPSGWSAGAVILSVVGILAVAGLVLTAGVAWVESIRKAERARVLAETTGVSRALLDAQRAAWQQERAALAAAAGRRDTVLRTRLQIVRDTQWLPADTSPAVRLVACRAQLDTLADACAAYRDTATAALDAADRLHAADTAALGRAALAVVAIRDTLRHERQAAARKPGWRGVAIGAASAAAAALATVFWLGGGR